MVDVLLQRQIIGAQSNSDRFVDTSSHFRTRSISRECTEFGLVSLIDRLIAKSQRCPADHEDLGRAYCTLRGPLFRY
jgi:hypothetical protein